MPVRDGFRCVAPSPSILVSALRYRIASYESPLLKPFQRKPQLAIPIVCVALALESLLLIYVARQTKPVAHLTVSELAKFRERYVGRQVFLSGVLVRGSQVDFDGPCSHRFELGHSGVAIPVRYERCVPGSTLGVELYDHEITVLGVLSPDWHFEVDELMERTNGPYRLQPEFKAQPEPEAWIADAGRDLPGPPRDDVPLGR
jgi:cytochrome c-type biogenesis protein CcmE